MALPKVEVEVTADTAQATAQLDRFNNELSETATRAKNTQAPLRTAGNRARSYGQQADRARGHTGNLAAQFNDIGVMLASGQSPLLLAVQQGTQINQVFTQMGGTPRENLRSLGAAAATMISPMSLLTLGVIAGGAALVQWGMSALGAGDDAGKLEDSIKSLKEETENARLEFEAMLLGFESIEQVRVQKRIEELNKHINRVTESIQAAQAEGAGGVFKASELNSQLAQLTAQRDELLQILGASEEAIGATARWEAAMSGVRAELGAIASILSQIGGGAIDAAAKRTEIAALQAGASLKEAARSAAEFKENLEVDAQVEALESRFGVFGKVIGGVVKGQVEYNRALDTTLEKEREVALEREKEAKKAAKRGGAGGGLSLTPEVTAKRLQALIDSLRTEQEVVDAWHAEQQAILADRRVQELLGIEKHNETRLRLEEEYQKRVAQLQQMANSQYLGHLSGFFGNMASVFQAGGERATKLAKGFAIAQGLINSYKAYTEVLADPSLVGQPWLRTALAASTLAAGLAQVANIRSVSTSGSGAGGGGDSAGAANQQSAPALPEQRIVIDAVGANQTDFRTTQALIEAMNDAAKRGVRLNPVIVGVA